MDLSIIPISRNEAFVWSATQCEPPYTKADIVNAYMHGYKSGYDKCDTGEAKPHRFVPPTEEEIETVRKEYVPGGATIKELAHRFGRTEHGMRAIIRKAGITKTRQWTAADRTFVATHLNIDMTAQELSDKFGVTVNAIKTIYQKSKV